MCVQYTCQWKYVSNVFLLKPLRCFGQQIFGAVIHGRISYLGTDVPYTCQWRYISDVFLLTPFHCFGPRIVDAIIYGRISYLGTSATYFLLLGTLPSAY